jgi:hypothetical protein
MEGEELAYICPLCHGKLLYRDVAKKTADAPRGQPGAEKFYCPHCEMLIEPMVGTREEPAGMDFPEAARGNRGRTRAGGTNAGGSQRGDLSDEGATQWLRDPEESERNTWKDKD